MASNHTPYVDQWSDPFQPEQGNLSVLVWNHRKYKLHGTEAYGIRLVYRCHARRCNAVLYSDKLSRYRGHQCHSPAEGLMHKEGVYHDCWDDKRAPREEMNGLMAVLLSTEPKLPRRKAYRLACFARPELASKVPFHRIDYKLSSSDFRNPRRIGSREDSLKFLEDCGLNETHHQAAVTDVENMSMENKFYQEVVDLWEEDREAVYEAYLEGLKELGDARMRVAWLEKLLMSKADSDLKDKFLIAADSKFGIEIYGEPAMFLCLLKAKHVCVDGTFKPIPKKANNIPWGQVWIIHAVFPSEAGKEQDEAFPCFYALTKYVNPL